MLFGILLPKPTFLNFILLLCVAQCRICFILNLGFILYTLVNTHNALQTALRNLLSCFGFRAPVVLWLQKDIGMRMGNTGFSPHIKLKAIDNLIVGMACCSYRKGFILSVIVYAQ